MSKGLGALKILYLYIPFYESDIIRADVDEKYHTIEKELKVLEIIKETLPINEDDFYEENGKYYFIGNEVDKDRFDLLKEVLL